MKFTTMERIEKQEPHFLLFNHCNKLFEKNKNKKLKLRMSQILENCYLQDSIWLLRCFRFLERDKKNVAIFTYRCLQEIYNLRLDRKCSPSDGTSNVLYMLQNFILEDINSLHRSVVDFYAKRYVQANQLITDVKTNIFKARYYGAMVCVNGSIKFKLIHAAICAETCVRAIQLSGFPPVLQGLKLANIERAIIDLCDENEINLWA